MIQNDAATRRLFQSRNVVGELIERLSDSVDEVVVEASGALRSVIFLHSSRGEVADVLGIWLLMVVMNYVERCTIRVSCHTLLRSQSRYVHTSAVL